jgi:uncharacterized glyoxalase superfamily protein PhnB
MRALQNLVPYAHVESVQRAIDFYEQLGFEAVNTFQPEEAERPVWAYLVSGGAQLMLAEADEPVDPSQQAVLFYLYTDDVVGLHAELGEAGVDVGEISHPFYMPAGEFRIEDPDGYVSLVAQLS